MQLLNNVEIRTQRLALQIGQARFAKAVGVHKNTYNRFELGYSDSPRIAIKASKLIAKLNKTDLNKTRRTP